MFWADRDGRGHGLEQTRVGADSISARFAAVRAVLASLVKGRWPSEARTEGLFRLEMPLTEGARVLVGPPGAAFGGGAIPGCAGPPGAAFCRGAIPRSPLSPPLTRGPNRCAFYARREPGTLRCCERPRADMESAPANGEAGIKFCAASFLTTRNMVYWTGSYKNLI